MTYRTDGEIWYDPPFVYRYDLKHNKTSRCGRVADKPLRYMTFKREVLRIYNSLGVSVDILDFLDEDLQIELIEFVLKGVKYYTTIRKLRQEGKPFNFKNEPCITYHLPLSKLFINTDPSEALQRVNEEKNKKGLDRWLK